VERSVAQVGDELYALPPQAFTAARDDYVARARGEGDTAAAKQLAALKKPTVVGYLVNLLALRRPDALERLLSLSGRMAGGQTDGATLRELAATRRQEIDALLTLTSDLATADGAPAPTRTQLAEVESTLSAALVDESAAALVRAGRVLKGLSYGGFGAWGGTAGGAQAETAPGAAGRAAGAPARGGAASGRDVAGDQAVGTSTAAGVRDEASAAQARQAAQDRYDVAEQAVADAKTTESALTDRAADLSTEIDQLKVQLEQVNRDARVARQARLAAERELASAQRRLNRVTG
jgi:hypothetical protein